MADELNAPNTTRFDTILHYLTDLYGQEPQGLIWIGGHADGFKGRAFDTPRAAAGYAEALDGRGGIGVYHRCTTLTARPREGRGTTDDSAAAYYFALDLDIQGPGHKAANLPASYAEVATLVTDAGLPAPTLWIASGGGFYPQWRFPEPINVTDAETRTWVADIFAQVSEHVITVAAERGWKIDNVRDLARVFRVPGTTNRKAEPVTATLQSLTGAPVDLGVLAGATCRTTRSVTPEASPPPAGETPFDDAPEHVFTRAQATEFIRAARRRLEDTTSGFNAAINAFAMTCAHFPWLVDRELCTKLVIRSLGPATGWTEPDEDDRRTVDSAYRATEAGKSWTAPEPAEGGQEARGQAGGTGGSGETLPPPTRPLDVARALLAEIPTTEGRPHRAWWRGDFYTWTRTHWAREEAPVIERWLYERTGDAIYRVPPRTEGGEWTEAPWAPTRKKIGDLAHALGVGLLQREGDDDRGDVVASNGVIRPGGRELKPHTPARFNLHSLGFAYDPKARCPQWLEFLDQVLTDDDESQDFIGEWFGYVLSGRIDQHKIAALIGKPRSGKGTVARALAMLVGRSAVAGLDLATLPETFGRQPLIGMSLAVASDVRWKSRLIGNAVPKLLEISGGDPQTIPRKRESAWHGTLGVRIMLMSNDAPSFTDHSGALANRLIYVPFRESFLGREDAGLGDRLHQELPGILNWALDGLDRLGQRGRFAQPSMGEQEAETTRRLSDPVGAFLDDWCVVDPKEEILLDHLYLKYRNWCESEGRDRDTTTKEVFSRDLRSKVNGIAVVRERRGEGLRMRVVKGLACDVL